MIPFPYDRNSSRAWQLLSRVNVTGLLRQLQVKIENIYLFKIIIKKYMETSLKASFAQIFSCCPKILSCPKFGGAAAPLGPRPMRRASVEKGVMTQIDVNFFLTPSKSVKPLHL